MEIVKKILSDPEYTKMEDEMAILVKLRSDFIETAEPPNTMKWNHLDTTTSNSASTTFGTSLSNKYGVPYITRDFLTLSVEVTDQASERGSRLLGRSMLVNLNHPAMDPSILKKFDYSRLPIYARINELSNKLTAKRKELLAALGTININNYTCTNNLIMANITESNVYLVANQVTNCGTKEGFVSRGEINRVFTRTRERRMSSSSDDDSSDDDSYPSKYYEKHHSSSSDDDSYPSKYYEKQHVATKEGFVSGPITTSARRFAERPERWTNPNPQEDKWDGIKIFSPAEQRMIAHRHMQLPRAALDTTIPWLTGQNIETFD